MDKRSPVEVITGAVVAVSFIAALALIIITVDQSQLPEGWLALFVLNTPVLAIQLANMSRTKRIGNQVDDLANGGMDAKIRAGVADTVRDEYLDPSAAPQLARDRARRDQLADGVDH